MKFVFVLTAINNTIYYKQLEVAILSLKLYNKDCFITVLTDDLTNKFLQTNNINLSDKCNEIKVIELDPKYNAVYRSRFLKTTIREHVTGDFLFLDTDIIVTDKIDCEELKRIEFGAVADQHGYVNKAFTNINETGFSERITYFYNIKAKLKHDNFYQNHFMDLTYFNSGVIWVKDTEKNHIFFKKWHENWLNNMKYKVFTDQPALAKTNYEYNSHIQEINGIWNVQVRNGINYLSKAKILHLLVTGNSEKATHCFGKKGFYENFNPDSQSDIEQIENAKSMFCDNLFIVAGKESSFKETSVYNVALSLFMKHKLIFSIISWFCNCIFKLNLIYKQIKENHKKGI